MLDLDTLFPAEPASPMRRPDTENPVFVPACPGCFRSCRDSGNPILARVSAVLSRLSRLSRSKNQGQEKKRRKLARVRRGARMNFAPLKRLNGNHRKPSERKLPSWWPASSPMRTTRKRIAPRPSTWCWNRARCSSGCVCASAGRQSSMTGKTTAGHVPAAATSANWAAAWRRAVERLRRACPTVRRASCCSAAQPTCQRPEIPTRGRRLNDGRGCVNV